MSDSSHGEPTGRNEGGLRIIRSNELDSNTPQTKGMTRAEAISYARAINPVHTMGDGDTIFAMSTGTTNTTADVSAIGAIAATVMSRAIVRAAMMATSVPELGLVAYRDYAGRG